MDIHLNFKKKHFYLFLIGLIVLVIGILAGAQTPNPGHSASEINFDDGVDLSIGDNVEFRNSSGIPVLVIYDSNEVDITGELYVNGFLIDPNPVSTWASSEDDIYYNLGNVGVGVSDPADITDTWTRTTEATGGGQPHSHGNTLLSGNSPITGSSGEASSWAPITEVLICCKD